MRNKCIKNYDSFQSAVSLSGTEVIVVNAEAGIMMRMEECVGEGNVTVYTGAGSGVQEYRYEMASWRFLCLLTMHIIFKIDRHHQPKKNQMLRCANVDCLLR